MKRIRLLAALLAGLLTIGAGRVTLADASALVPTAAPRVALDASPASAVCGESTVVTFAVKDGAGQPVSDHTPVEVITNAGGVLSGTPGLELVAGSSPQTPLSSALAETFNGVATVYLLTSSSNAGPYEVVATAGGSIGASPLGRFVAQRSAGPPVSALVTLTCRLADDATSG